MTGRRKRRSPAERALETGAERELPANVEAERVLLGSIFMAPDEALAKVTDWLDPEEFYLPKHRAIYAAAQRVFRRQAPPDLQMVAEELRRQEATTPDVSCLLDELGGLSYLIECANQVPTAMHAVYYAKAVKRTAILRKLIQAGGTIAALGYIEHLEDEGLVETLGTAHKFLYDVSSGVISDDVNHISHYTTQTLERVARKEAPGLRLQYPYLQWLTTGLHRGEVTTIGARPAVGKTSFALDMAVTMAELGAKIFFLSMEMKGVSLADRMISRISGIPLKRFRQGNFTLKELARAAEAKAYLDSLPILIDESDTSSIIALRERFYAKAAEYGMPDVVFLDYIQLMAPDEEAENRVQEITKITRAIKKLAMTLNIHVVALSQLNRGLEGRDSKVPGMADFRDGGSIEQDSDNLWAIYRKDIYLSREEQEQLGPKVGAQIILLKARNGELGAVDFYLHKRIQWWEPKPVDIPTYELEADEADERDVDVRAQIVAQATPQHYGYTPVAPADETTSFPALAYTQVSEEDYL